MAKHPGSKYIEESKPIRHVTDDHRFGAIVADWLAARQAESAARARKEECVEILKTELKSNPGRVIVTAVGSVALQLRPVHERAREARDRIDEIVTLVAGPGTAGSIGK